MATAGGPDIITDGLVFGYDADDRSPRFYPGEPTTNLASGLTVGAQGGSLTSTTPTPDGKYLTDNTGVGNNGLPMYHEVTAPNTGNNGGFQSQTHFNIIGGSTYLYISFKVYMTEVYSGTNRYLGGYAGFYNSSDVSTGNAGWTYTVDGVADQSWSDNPAHLNKWIQVSGRATIPANTAKVHRWYVYADWLLTGKMYVAQLQIEESNNPTQYTSTSRSSTQSLIDLKKTTTIDVSNVSFDSTAHPIFDGSNDYISIPVPQSDVLFSNVFTWEFVMKFNGNNGTHQGIVWSEATGNLNYLLTLYNYNNFHIRIQNSATGWDNNDVNISFDPSKYNHIIFQFNNGVTKMYVNGELIDTDSSRGSYTGPSTAALYIGCRNDLAYDLNGNIPVIKHYNQALTALEVTQNFNAYKNRFNI